MIKKDTTPTNESASNPALAEAMRFVMAQLDINGLEKQVNEAKDELPALKEAMDAAIEAYNNRVAFIRQSENKLDPATIRAMAERIVGITTGSYTPATTRKATATRVVKGNHMAWDFYVDGKPVESNQHRLSVLASKPRFQESGPSDIRAAVQETYGFALFSPEMDAYGDDVEVILEGKTITFTRNDRDFE